jgi:hypothetical protein
VGAAGLPRSLVVAPEFQSLCPATAICMTKSLPSVGVGVSHE